MKIQTLGWLVGLSAIAFSFTSCAQTEIVCVAAHGGTPGANQDGAAVGVGFAATYELKGAAPMCATTTKAPLSSVFPPFYPDDKGNRQKSVTLDKLKGDLIGFETYHPVEMTENGPEPDFTKGSVALQADGLGQYIKTKGTRKNPDLSAFKGDTNADDKAYAFGDWQSIKPTEDGICNVVNLKPATKEIPAVPLVQDIDPKKPGDQTQAAEPAVSIKYEWKNLKVYTTAAAQGTQFSGDLAYTQDMCAVDYHVLGVWPTVGCEKYGDPDNSRLGLPDDAACCPNANPDKGRPAGSGINPDFPVVCDPILLVCVLKSKPGQEVPVLDPGWDADNRICNP